MNLTSTRQFFLTAFSKSLEYSTFIRQATFQHLFSLVGPDWHALRDAPCWAWHKVLNPRRCQQCQKTRFGHTMNWQNEKILGGGWQTWSINVKILRLWNWKAFGKKVLRHAQDKTLFCRKNVLKKHSLIGSWWCQMLGKWWVLVL